MVLFICQRCGHNCKKRSDFISHIQRKTKCPNINNGPEYPDGTIPKTKLEKLLNQAKVDDGCEPPKPKSIKKPTITKPKPEKKIKCKYCKLELSRSCHLSRHLSVCKVKKTQDNLNILRVKNPPNRHTTNITNIQNTKIHSTNVTNNNIILNSYHNTDMSYLSEKDYITCLATSSGAVRTLIEKTHFDNRYPQNHNIYINNIRSKYIKIYDGKKWIVEDQEEVLDDIIDHSHCMLDMKSMQLLTNSAKYDDVISKYEKYVSQRDSEAVIKKVRDELRLLLYNKRACFNQT